MLNTFSIDNLKDRYWSMGSRNERGPRERTGGPESWTVPPPWKLYFNPWRWWWWRCYFHYHFYYCWCWKILDE